VQVDLGSGASIQVDTEPKKVFVYQERKNLLKQAKAAKGIYPKAKSSSVSFEEDGVKFVSESTPLQYVTLDSIIDELPDFAVETLSESK
jgi:hypothetical protein